MRRTFIIATVGVACGMSACSTADIAGNLAGQFDIRKNPVAVLTNLYNGVASLREVSTVVELKNSYFFTVVKTFFPDGVPRDPSHLRELSGEQRARADAFLAERAAQLYGDAAALLAASPDFKAMAARPARFTQTRFRPRVQGEPEAIVDLEGTVYVDEITFQSILRSVVLDWARRAAEGSDLAVSEGELIDRFNRYIHQVSVADGSMHLTMYKRLLLGAPAPDDSKPPAPTQDGDGKDDGPWWERLLVGMAERGLGAMSEGFEAQARLEATRDAQEAFSSAVDFVLAHELAHWVFDHPATRANNRARDAVDCATMQRQELQADEFGAAVLILQRFQSSTGTELSKEMASNSYTIHSMGHTRNIAGFRLFLDAAFPLAGFTPAIQGDCRYPEPKLRLARLNVGDRYALAALEHGLALESMHKAAWFESADENKVDGIRHSAAATLAVDSGDDVVVAVEPPVGARWQSLIDPMIVQRFKGNV